MKLEKIKNMFIAMIPIFIYFFIAFQIVALTSALILKEYNITVSSFSNATILALIMAKVVLIVDEIEYVNISEQRPLIHKVLWKTLVYLIVTLLFSYIEHLIHFWKEASGFSEANSLLFEDIVFTHYLAIQLWLLVLVFIFCILRELVNYYGRQEIYNLFFKTRT